mgnify:CR=1 FL=1
MNIGFIGLGNMGYPIMLRLCNLEHNLFVYDENLVKFKQLKKTERVICCDNASSVAKKSDVVFTCLPSIENVEYVLLGQKNYKGICNVLKSGSLCVDLSSSDPLKTKILAKKLKKKNIRFLDAPISGGVTGAIDGSLTVMVGGEETDFNFVKPILKLFGKKILHVGDFGSGQAAKCLNNLCSATGLLIAAECVNVAKSFGIEENLFIDLLNVSTGKNNSTENKIKQFILSKNFDSGFAISLMKKDLASAVKLATDQKVSTPLGAKSLDFWDAAANFLPSESDHTEIAKWLRSLDNLS